MKLTITKSRYFLAGLLVSIVSNFGFSQTNNSEEKIFAEDAFVGTQLINSQTTNVFHPRSWQFEIQHRFGSIGVDSSFINEFLGMDLPAVMRMAFGWSISDRLYFKIGRTNHLKTYDLEWKYLIAKQTADFRMPVSIALYNNIAVRTERFPNIPANSFFDDDVTPFEYKPSHRLSYNTQLIVSSKLSDKLSVQLTPVFVYRNLAPPYHDNFNMVLSGAVRYKVGHKASILAEYAHVFNNRKNNFQNPMSVGVEMGTPNHVFQLFFSNTNKVLENHIYTESSMNVFDGNFLLGFNLQKNFWRK